MTNGERADRTNRLNTLGRARLGASLVGALSAAGVAAGVYVGLDPWLSAAIAAALNLWIGAVPVLRELHAEGDRRRQWSVRDDR